MGDALASRLWGNDLFGEPMAPKASGPLASRFIVPPFSVLNAREGDWQDRKRAWIEAGVKADDGTRDDVLGVSKAAELMAKYNGKEANSKLNASTSIFDPVLAELVFRWFCPPNGTVIDPFGGESTKGIVAASLGLQYHGVELRQDQVDANAKQAQAIGLNPVWHCGDSSRFDEILPKEIMGDLVFTSPPYYDLEVYEGGKDDGSVFASYTKFRAWYKEVFAQCVLRMRPNRFLVVKVGEIRDERGIYRNFVGDNIACFTELGLHYYNEIILVTAVGSLPIRTGRQFASKRKVGKTHQNILCFFKGNPDRIPDDFPALD